MLRLKPQERTARGETIRDLANLTAGVLVLGQFVGERPSWWLVLAGAAAWILLVGSALLLLRGAGDG